MNQSNPQKNGMLRWLVFSLMLFGLLSISWKIISLPNEKPETTILTSNLDNKPKVEKDADKILKQMSDYVTAMQQFSYKSKGTVEMVEGDKKVQQSYTSEVYVKRPNKMRVNVKNENRDGSVYYDGKQFTVLGRNANMYAVADAPPTLDAALDSARDRFMMDPPGADLIYTYPYKGLIDNVTEGKQLEEQKINGKQCNHLAFKSKDVDWEIWVQKSSTPVPMKYKIVSKNEPQRPEFTVEFTDWKQGEGADFADQQFAFNAPANAKKIPFMRLGDAPATAAQTKNKK